jgi:hypothetical protein
VVEGHYGADREEETFEEVPDAELEAGGGGKLHRGLETRGPNATELRRRALEELHKLAPLEDDEEPAP